MGLQHAFYVPGGEGEQLKQVAVGTLTASSGIPSACQFAYDYRYHTSCLAAQDACGGEKRKL